MLLAKLGAGLKQALRKITNAGYVDSKIIDEMIRDLQRTLLAGDVDVKLVFSLTEKIRKRALDEKPPSGLTPKEHVVRIVYEELVSFVGKKPEIQIKPSRILLIGLFGSGKTTSIGKLANFYKKKGLSIALIGCDVHRPAAMDQLAQLADQLKVHCFAPKNEKNPIKIAKEGLEKFKKYDVLIFDSSGRDALDQELANELKELGQTIKADEVLLTIPADIGQAAGPQATEFNKLVGITGIFLSKLDSTARGGGAITACTITESPVKFIGIGEKMDALEIFDPERFVSRLIGWGDIQALMEKAKEAISPDKAEKMKSRLESGKFTLSDFLEQIESMQKMGPLKGVMDMIPGIGGMRLPKGTDLDKQEEKMKHWKYAIQSMTTKEKENPEILTSQRITRISKGSAVPESEIRELLKNFKQSKKIMKMMTSRAGKRGAIGKLMRKFKGF